MPFVTKVKESVASQGPKAMNVTLDFDEKALYEEVNVVLVLAFRSTCFLVSLFSVVVAVGGGGLRFLRLSFSINVPILFFPSSDDLLHDVDAGVRRSFGCLFRFRSRRQNS